MRLWDDRLVGGCGEDPRSPGLAGDDMDSPALNTGPIPGIGGQIDIRMRYSSRSWARNRWPIGNPVDEPGVWDWITGQRQRRGRLPDWPAKS